MTTIQNKQAEIQNNQQQLELPFGLKRMLKALHDCKVGVDGSIEAPRRQFAEILQVHVSTISRYTKQLAERNLIQVIRGTRIGQLNRYIIVKAQVEKKSCATEWYDINDPAHYYRNMRKHFKTPILFTPGSRSDLANHKPPSREDMFLILEQKIEHAIKEPDAELNEMPKYLVNYTVFLQRCDFEYAFRLVTEVVAAYRWRMQRRERAYIRLEKAPCRNGAYA